MPIVTGGDTLPLDSRTIFDFITMDEIVSETLSPERIERIGETGRREVYTGRFELPTDNLLDASGEIDDIEIWQGDDLVALFDYEFDPGRINYDYRFEPDFGHFLWIANGDIEQIEYQMFAKRAGNGSINGTVFDDFLDRIGARFIPPDEDSPLRVSILYIGSPGADFFRGAPIGDPPGYPFMIDFARPRIGFLGRGPFGLMDYTGSPEGVDVRLWDSAPESGGHAEGDTIVDILSVWGSQFDDTLSGTDLPNEVEGREGNDVIAGREGDDILRGGYGDDIVDGGPGDDPALIGGPGMDTVYGGPGDDAIRGNSQNDLIRAGNGSDRAYGNIGGDRVYGDGGDDALWGLSGNDRVYGGPGDDQLLGGFGGDVLQGGPGRDILQGEGGTDIFQFLPTDGSSADVIEDFDLAGRFPDRIDIHRWLAELGYAGSTPVADGIVRVVDLDGDASVRLVTDDGTVTLARVLDTDAAALADDAYFVTTDTFWFGS